MRTIRFLSFSNPQLPDHPITWHISEGIREIRVIRVQKRSDYLNAWSSERNMMLASILPSRDRNRPKVII